jgi:hypothetical protein
VLLKSDYNVQQTGHRGEHVKSSNTHTHTHIEHIHTDAHCIRCTHTHSYYVNFVPMQGARKLEGDNLKLVWAEFTTIS